MENKSIRLLARGAGVPLWEIAQHIGVSENTLLRWLRVKLDDVKREKIMTAIREIQNSNVQ